MSDQAQASAPQQTAPATQTGSKITNEYLNRAVETLKKFGFDKENTAPQELITLLEEVKHIDEAKVLAIADVIQHMSAFNALVRENVEGISVGNRYMDITQMFDSVREDSKRLIAQLDDGKISGTEKVSNWWMKIRRGTPSDRFEKIVDVYSEVAKATKDQLRREEAIMEGYIDFRFALKEAEILARELFDMQVPTLEAAKDALSQSQTALDEYAGTDEAGKSALELARDEARHRYEKEDQTYQLLKDIAENLEIGYDVGETLITKLKQTHDVKDRVYRRSVTFFTTNEHVFTILGTVYTSQHGLHEVTQATEAMKEGVNKGLEDIADLGRELERAALKAGYGSTINPESVQKLVDSISDFQIESLQMIADLRKESEESTRAIRRSVEEGKKKYQETLARHARGDQLSS
ncbi:MAG: cell surface protein [Rubripirellula sp.]|nr:cell surface protein [Rubripirellula sp.]